MAHIPSLLLCQVPFGQLSIMHNYTEYTYTETHADVIRSESRARTREEVHSVRNAHRSAILPFPRRQLDTRRGSVKGML